jgi:hypothetical protein
VRDESISLLHSHIFKVHVRALKMVSFTLIVPSRGLRTIMKEFVIR